MLRDGALLLAPPLVNLRLPLPLPRQHRPRRLILIMVVRDEAEVLAANLAFHFARGVDFALVVDHASRDGTAEVLEKFQREGRLAWWKESDPHFQQQVWMTRLALLARDKHGADWVLCCDADEFWCPDEGSLKDFIARQRVPVLRCRRENEVRVLAPADGGGESGRFLDHHYAPVLRPRAWQYPGDDRSARELSDPRVPGLIFHEEPPKVLARADVIHGVHRGSHYVQKSRWTLQTEPTGLVIRHFPVRDATQFATKVQTGGIAYSHAKHPPHTGWHWKHWQACALRGELPAAFARETLRPGEVPLAPVQLGPARPARVALGFAATRD